MNRLRKIALGGDIQQSDIEFQYAGNNLKMLLVNNEKALHDQEESWWGTYYYDRHQESQNVIGFISYSETTEKDDSFLIYVHSMEMREEYRQTRAVKFLMNEFKENVIDTAIDQFGKETVMLGAEVVNQDLSGFLKRLTDKAGIKFKDFNTNGFDEVAEDDENNSLSQSGLNVIQDSSMEVAVQNSPMSLFINNMNEEYDLEKIIGFIDEQANIVYGISSSYISKELKFEYSSDSNEIKCRFDVYALLKKGESFLNNLINNLSIVFTEQDLIKLRDRYEGYTISSLSTYIKEYFEEMQE